MNVQNIKAYIYTTERPMRKKAKHVKAFLVEKQPELNTHFQSEVYLQLSNNRQQFSSHSTSPATKPAAFGEFSYFN